MFSNLSEWQELDAESFEDARKVAAELSVGSREVFIGVLDNTKNKVVVAEKIVVQYEGDSEWHDRPHA
jgi:hypothetical protein